MKSKKRLQDMSLEELWQLFPIIIEEHNPLWNEQAAQEIEELKGILADYSPIINHIGSTAISGICAKPIVDLLVETADSCGWEEIVETMETNGYTLMAKSEKRMSFNKGYTEEGFADKVFHIHFHIKGDNDEIIFRDYLRENPQVAREYADLKLSLLSEYRHNRDGYTEAKTDFVKKVVAQAKQSKSKAPV